MAKKHNAGNNTAINTPAPAVPANTKEATAAPTSFLMSFRGQAIIIAILGLIFYFNTFQNEFVLDDRPIVVENEYVQQGLAGIPKILTSDAFASYLEQRNSGKSLAGGRYRPLSIVTFAIEQQILGLPSSQVTLDIANSTKGVLLSKEAHEKINHDMHFRHVVNVALYILSVIVLLYFLRTIVFPENAMIPLIAAVLFVIHPIHTEVMANVKSRDEIMSLLFICLTFIFALRYYDSKKKKSLLGALLCFFLALLSKEYALTLVVLLPLAFYLFRKETVGRSFTLILPYILPLAAYVLMRLSAEGSLRQAINEDIVSNPYLFATPVQKVASIIAVLFYYLRLLVFPYPLSSDYSYAQLPYNNFSNAVVWLSLIIYADIITAFVLFFRKRHVLSFAIAIYLANLALVSNIFVGLGATMGERLMFHSSVGFVIVVAYGLYEVTKRLGATAGNIVVAAFLTFVAFFSARVTFARNADWKNDQTLFLKDVQTSPNSMLILGNAGSACIDRANEAQDTAVKKQWFRQGIGYFDRVLAIYHPNARGWLNRGVCYYYLGEEERGFSDWDSLRKYNPGDPALPYLRTIKGNYYSKEGLKYGQANQHEQAIVSFTKALHATPEDPDVWFNLGVAYFSSGRYNEATKALDRSLQIRPGNQRVLQFYEIVKQKMR